MNHTTIDAAEREAKRFLERVRAARVRLAADYFARYGCRETADLRRASMDLTRALADMRRPHLWENTVEILAKEEASK